MKTSRLSKGWELETTALMFEDDYGVIKVFLHSLTGKKEAFSKHFLVLFKVHSSVFLAFCFLLENEFHTRLTLCNTAV